jgi:hypothetical protein
VGITFASLSRATHAALKSAVATLPAGPPFPLGHVHEALSAVLGHNTHAAYKTAAGSGEEPVSYSDAQHVILDLPRLEQRLVALGHGQLTAKVAEAVRSAFAALVPDAQVHDEVADLEAAIYADVIDEIENSDGYSSELAMTNAYGGDFDITFDASVPLDAFRGDWTLAVSGTSSLEQDPDKVYHGDTLDVTAQVVFQKLGRRVLGEMTVENAGGSIQREELDPSDEMPDFEQDDDMGGARV